MRKMQRRRLAVLLSAVGILTSTGARPTPDWPKEPHAPRGAPNILLVLLDDAGFSAAGTFGGLIPTPALDRLAASGLRYNQFQVTAICSPTRAALLSGRNAHHIGFGTVEEVAAAFPGYDGVWKKDAVSIAEVLLANGYSTAAFGKWHNTPYWEISPVGPFNHWPTHLGFEHFYGFMTGETSQWEPPLYLDTTPVDPPATADQGYTLNVDIVNKAIDWIQTHESLAPQKPYFMYFAPGATHAPLQVPKVWSDRFRGQFDAGWDVLRKRIFYKEKKLGFIPANTDLTPRPKEIPAWASLTDDQKEVLERQMEVYAGYLEQTDYEVGRLVSAAETGPQGSNTLIFYIVGDNGPSGMDGLMGTDDEQAPAQPIQIRLRHLDEIGGPKHNDNYAAGWAWMTATPLQWTKLIASHLGGTRNPLVVSWPAKIKDRGGLRSQFINVTDVVPTIYEVTGIHFPATVDGVRQIPLDGISFAYTFNQPKAPSRHHVQYFESFGNRAIYEDGWIAGARHTLPWGKYSNPDFSHDRWELYHLPADFSEAHDLAAVYPERLKHLQELFDVEARRNNVYPLGLVVMPQPFPVDGQKSSTYHRNLPRTPGLMAPNTTLSHRIVAYVTLHSLHDQGVVVTDGSRFGGFVLFIKDDHVIYENNDAGQHEDTIVSDIALPVGKVRIEYEFTREGSGTPYFRTPAYGLGRLFVNGKLVGQKRIHVSAQQYFSPNTFSIGETRISPVSDSYQMPFKFTGEIQKVQIRLM